MRPIKLKEIEKEDNKNVNNNTNRENNNNSNKTIKLINIDYDIDYWELFQSETDETRNLLLNFLTNKCEIHKTEDFFDPENYNLNEVKNTITKNFHFEECRNYLFISEKRRNPFKNGKLLYSETPCQNFLKKISCPNKENCDFSHNQLEILFHPFNFRKQICNFNECEKNKLFCFNAHRNQEKRRFPYIKKNSCVSKDNKNNNNNYNKDKEKEKEKEKDKDKYSDKDFNIINQLNFDIKNLLDEVNFDIMDEFKDDLIKSLKDEDLNLNESNNYNILFKKF
jgi:hypothetical protein